MSTKASNLQGVDAPWPPSLAGKRSPDKKLIIRRLQELKEKTGRRDKKTRETEETATGKPPGADRDLVAGQGRQRGR